jgi:FKBP-type peptidyl-prolyl cis-trans isomerase FkpA
MRVFLILLPAALLAQAPAPKSPAAPPKAATGKAAPSQAAAGGLVTDEQKTIYALGLAVYQSLKPFELSPSELEIVKRAISDAAAGKPAVELNVFGPKLNDLQKARAARSAEKEKGASKAFLDKAAQEPGAVKDDSGLIYRVLTPGTGASPKATDTVKVNYRGTLINGTEFDSSFKRNQPAQFPLNGVIRCWSEGLQKMKVGGKSQLVCPSDIAYGDNGRPPMIPGGATLIFEVELLEVTAAPPAAPASPAAKPAVPPRPAPTPK